MQSDESHLKKQFEFEPRRGGCTRDMPESTSEGNSSLGENIQELGAQYDQELADLRYERESFNTRLIIYGSRNESPCDSLCF